MMAKHPGVGLGGDQCPANALSALGEQVERGDSPGHAAGAKIHREIISERWPMQPHVRFSFFPPPDIGFLHSWKPEIDPRL